jgi:proline iminopeptidase
MRSLYPAIEPTSAYAIEVGRHHQLYVEECGNPHGVPVVFLHGGPGSGCRPYHRSFFDPERYRIVLFDQRGAGRSVPNGDLTDNNTDELVADLERVRIHLGIDRWVLFGGSWGATLVLLYAQRHPARVLGMILRGVFLARQRDLEWYMVDGANRIYPECWSNLIRHSEARTLTAITNTFHKLLHGKDELAKLRFAKAWTLWGAQLTLGDDVDPSDIDNRSPASLLLQVGIELHYARNRYFLEDNQVLDHCDRMPRVPTLIVHGRNDLVCPPEAAVTLHQHLPGSELRIVPRAGHAASTPEIIDALVTATDDLLPQIRA